MEKVEGSAIFFKPDPDCDDYFIMYLLLPGGPQISYHLQNAYLTLLPASAKAAPCALWDGHTSSDVVLRLTSFIKNW